MDLMLFGNSFILPDLIVSLFTENELRNSVGGMLHVGRLVLGQGSLCSFFTATAAAAAATAAAVFPI